VAAYVQTRQRHFRARDSCLSGEAPVTAWTALTLQRSAVSRTRATLLIVSANWLIALSASFSPDPVAKRCPRIAVAKRTADYRH
jgi:hypothetical protein